MHHFLTFAAVGVSLVWWTPSVRGHGRLWEPPGRSTMWRRQYDTPINYSDNQLFCGGFAVSLDYKCGLCGDPYDGVRENEAGGKYATGLITRTYEMGEEVTFQIEITANHLGFFEFKLCPTDSPEMQATQECMDDHVITMAATGDTQYPVHKDMIGKQTIHAVLPTDLTCDSCVLQWRYHTGNSWGTDPDGHSCLGCGYQEEFYGCADIRIVPPGQGGVTDSVTSSPGGEGDVSTEGPPC